MAEAVDIIATRRESLLHMPKVQEEAFYRLRNYPGQIAANCHNALVAIPRKLACVVRTKPRLVSAAVEAFYLRDPIALRPLQSEAAVRRTPFPPVDLVTVPVRFARAGYAQLKCQHFAPPPSWVKILAVDAGEEKDKEKEKQKGKQSKASASASASRSANGGGNDDRLGQLETGMKLTCGFIMLVCDPQNREKESVKYIRRLLEAMDRGDVQLPSDDDVERWRAEREPDDERWLGIDFTDLERELNLAPAARKDGEDRTTNIPRGSKAAEEEEEEEEEAAETSFRDKNTHENLRKLVQRLDSFLGDETAGADGAGIFDGEDDDMGDDDDDDEESQDAEEDDDDVSLNEEEFARMMREMMGLPPSAAAATATATATATAPATATDPAQAASADASVSLPRQRFVELGTGNDAGSGGEESDNDDDDSEADLQDIMRRMDAELRETGVLDLHPPPPPPVGSAALADGRHPLPSSVIGGGSGSSSSRADKSVQSGHNTADDADDDDDDGDEEGDVRIDYALAANLLKSLGGGGGGSVGGDPSSAGNLLASLGFGLRDGT
jgi:hypothetical protein